jgi:hypothetical protein
MRRLLPALWVMAALLVVGAALRVTSLDRPAARDAKLVRLVW